MHLIMPTNRFLLIRNFRKRISTNGLNGVKVAAFDTRFSLSNIESSALRTIVKMGGYAARSIAQQRIYALLPLVTSGFVTFCHRYQCGKTDPTRKLTNC